MTTEAEWREIAEQRRIAHATALTQPAERAATERIIGDLYARMGRPKPECLWFDGPVSCMIASHVAERELGCSLRGEVWRKLWLPLEHELDSSIDSAERYRRQNPIRFVELGGALGGRLEPEVVALMRGNRWRTLGDDFWSQLSSQLQRQTDVRLEAPLDDWIHWRKGLWSGERVGRYVGYEWAGVKFQSPARAALAVWDELQRSCAWWYPFEHAAICSEGWLLHLDAACMPHNARGPAVECRDGYKLDYYAWHGTELPGVWMDESARREPWMALHLPYELRTAAAEIVGWSRMSYAMREVDRHPDPQIGTLLDWTDLKNKELEVEEPWEDSWSHRGRSVPRLLRVRCGTGREFVLKVPREMTTALEANAWTFGLRPEDLTLEVRT